MTQSNCPAGKDRSISTALLEVPPGSIRSSKSPVTSAASVAWEHDNTPQAVVGVMAASATANTAAIRDLGGSTHQAGRLIP